MSTMEKVTDFSKLIPPQAPPRWNHAPEDIIEEVKASNEKLKAITDKLASTEDPTLDGIFKEYADCMNQYSVDKSVMFYKHVGADEKMRIAADKAVQLASDVGISQYMRVDGFKTIEKLYHKYHDDKKVDPEIRRYLDKAFLEYEIYGLTLSDDKRKKVEELHKEISLLEQEFSKNYSENKSYLLFTEQELDGIPEKVIGNYEKVVVDGIDKYKMTFKYPDFHPLMSEAKVESTRKAAWIGNETRCRANNSIVKALIVRRTELALVLGRESYSAHHLQNKMAKNPETVMTFLNNLKTKLEPKAKKELAVLLALKNADLESRGLPTQDKFYDWDFRFYKTLFLKRNHEIDLERISEYFPMDQTISKILGFYEKLFNMKFVEMEENKSVWHSEVKQFGVWCVDDMNDPEFLGWLYFDLHPREGKYPHGANINISPYFINIEGAPVYSVTAMVCNFTKPTADRPSLLKHREVLTFFHELGHAVHIVFAKAKYARLSGVAVSLDFVEAPSQMLEFWVWHKDRLRELSSHYETGEPMDEELLQHLVESKNANGALDNMRQLFLTFFDMNIHMVKSLEEAEALDLTGLWNQSTSEIALTDIGGEVGQGYNRFSHISSGYGSSYYSYLYSKVFAADMYYTLFKDNNLNTENGIRYRDILLRKVGLQDELETLTELLGREPNVDAFAMELGI